MKFFSLDSPLMNILGKMADLMWLNILTMICCIPVFTAGAALTALNYMALKIVRNEECYITKGYFKSFKENFKQATAIWFLVLLVGAVIAGDVYIMVKETIELNNVFKYMIMVAGILAIMTTVFVFPVLAKFENTIMGTLRNAFFMSVWQFPKTVLILVFIAAPIVLMFVSYRIFPFVFLFGFSVPAWGAALLYNKTFQKLEDRLLAGDNPEEGEASGEAGSEENPEEDERIFKDELDESIIVDEKM